MSVRRRHVPLRTCVVCGNKTEKRSLLRVVATPEGGVRLDPTGKMNGRGAYVCQGNEACTSADLKRERLERALRTTIGSGAWASLLAETTSRRAETPA